MHSISNLCSLVTWCGSARTRSCSWTRHPPQDSPSQAGDTTRKGEGGKPGEIAEKFQKFKAGVVR